MEFKFTCGIYFFTQAIALDKLSVKEYEDPFKGC